MIRTPAARARRAASMRHGASTNSPRSRPRRRPELEHHHAKLQEAIEQRIGLVFRLFELLGDGAVEANARPEPFAQNGDVIGRIHRVRANDAELPPHLHHRFRLGDTGIRAGEAWRAVLRVRRAGLKKVRVNVDDGARIVQVGAVAVIRPGDVVLGRSFGSGSGFAHRFYGQVTSKVTSNC